MSALAQLLWYNQPYQVVSYQLFTFQAKFNQEHFPSTLQIALNFGVGLEHLSLGKWALSLTEQQEELTKQLAFQQESHLAQIKALSQQLEEANAQRTGSQLEHEMSLKLQATELQLQALQMKYQSTNTRYTSLAADNESLKKKYEAQTSQLHYYRQSLEDSLKNNAQLGTTLQELNLRIEELMQQWQTLQKDLEDKTNRYVFLEGEKSVLEKKVKSQANELKKHIVKLNKSSTSLHELRKKNYVLKNRLKSWGITKDPPIESQEPMPDYSTPQSRAALVKFGPYSGQDEEHILIKRGTVVDETGVYIGQWNARNQQHGYGKYLWKDGHIYERQWRSDQRTGRGRFIWANGDVYVGDFVQGRMEGFGTMYLADGGEYSGAWVNSKAHGVGSEKLGETSQRAADRYFGDYLDDVKNGVGAYLGADGSIYVGSWKSDKQNGKGLWVHSNGDMYFGEYAGGLMTGTGCYMWPNGDVYKGQWTLHKKNGRGELTHPGQVETGVWIDDVLHTE